MSSEGRDIEESHRAKDIEDLLGEVKDELAKLRSQSRQLDWQSQSNAIVFEEKMGAFNAGLAELKNQSSQSDNQPWGRKFQALALWVRATSTALVVLGFGGGAGFVAADISEADYFRLRKPAIERVEEQKGPALKFLPAPTIDLEDIADALDCPENIRKDLKPSGPIEIFLLGDSISPGRTEADYGALILSSAPPFSYEKGYHYECTVDLYVGGASVQGYQVQLADLIERRNSLRNKE